MGEGGSLLFRQTSSDVGGGGDVAGTVQVLPALNQLLSGHGFYVYVMRLSILSARIDEEKEKGTLAKFNSDTRSHLKLSR